MRSSGGQSEVLRRSISTSYELFDDLDERKVTSSGLSAMDAARPAWAREAGRRRTGDVVRRVGAGCKSGLRVLHTLVKEYFENLRHAGCWASPEDIELRLAHACEAFIKLANTCETEAASPLGMSRLATCESHVSKRPTMSRHGVTCWQRDMQR